MVGGGSSLRGVMPLVFIVTSDQFWPASRCQPDAFQSTVPYRWRIRGVNELVSFELAVCAAPRKSNSE